MRKILLPLLIISLLSSCVARKKYRDLEGNLNAMRLQSQSCATDLAALNVELANQKGKNQSLQDEIDHLKKTNTNLLDRMADLSVITKSESENIKKSLEAINSQNQQIGELNTSIHRKDSINLALVMNLKRSLSDVNDQDVNIEVKKGVVYISLSDKMLFKSGSYQINASAEKVLGKIASVANDHKDLDLLIEGHTDNVPIATACIEDNWDLSAKRATEVVRTLQKKFNVAPERMTAGGRSEYVNKSGNDTKEGKSLNRRTEIIILPKLDQFFQLLEKK